MQRVLIPIATSLFKIDVGRDKVNQNFEGILKLFTKK